MGFLGFQSCADIAWIGDHGGLSTWWLRGTSWMDAKLSTAIAATLVVAQTVGIGVAFPDTSTGIGR